MRSLNVSPAKPTSIADALPASTSPPTFTLPYFDLNSASTPAESNPPRPVAPSFATGPSPCVSLPSSLTLAFAVMLT